MKGQTFIPLVVVAAGLLAYHNSFTDPFIFDDEPSIQENPTIHYLWPIWPALSPPHTGGATVEGRPVINLSLAINYALGGLDVWGYHVLNLTIHILAGLTLLGIVRRTLLQPRLRERFGAEANELALATALLWTVHPLQTESVTYIVQRAESMMGLFYLLTLYCFIRGAESPPHPKRWYGLCASACALGMASKEVMVSAPLMVLLYDRTFVSGSFREAWRRRWRLYLALANTWIVLGCLLPVSLRNAATNANIDHVVWWKYLLTEPGVILHYLRLTVWPHPLCFDYCGWPMASSWMSIVPPALVMVGLLGAGVWAWEANSAWGFLSAWFFLILAPSSSIIPCDSPAYEHRMYLPLAAVAVLAVMGIRVLVGRRTVVVIVALVIGLGALTWRRNQDYRSTLTIWSDTVAKRPDNARAHDGLGNALRQSGKVTEAIGQHEQALRIKPDFAEAHNNLGFDLWQAGRVQEALGHYEQALRLKPDFAEAHNNLGNVLAQAGKVQEAIGNYVQALQIKPDYAEAHYNWGLALAQAGKLTEAIGQYEQALRIKPDFAEAHYNWGNALAQAGKLTEAIGQYEQALRIRPDYTEAHNNLGMVFAKLGRRQEAMEHWKQALRIKPDFAEAHYNWGLALAQAGKVQEAMGHWEQALRSKPDFAEAHNNLGFALWQAGRVQEAIEHYEQALRIKPDFAEAQSNLARARTVQ